MAEQEPKPMTDLETLAHNLDLWVEDAKQHNSEYVPVHRKTLAQMNDHLRELSRLQAGGRGVEPVARLEYRPAGSDIYVYGVLIPDFPIGTGSDKNREEVVKAINSAAHPPAATALVPLTDGAWYWVQYEGLGKTYEAPAMYRSDAKAFYSVQFSGIPERHVKVRHSINGLTMGDAPNEQEAPK